jgi:hypothetical protein
MVHISQLLVVLESARARHATILHANGLRDVRISKFPTPTETAVFGDQFSIEKALFFEQAVNSCAF